MRRMLTSSPAISITRTQSQKVCSSSNHWPSGSNHSAIVCPKPQSELYCQKPCCTKSPCLPNTIKSLCTLSCCVCYTVSNTEELLCGRQWQNPCEVALLGTTQREWTLLLSTVYCEYSENTGKYSVCVYMCVCVCKTKLQWEFHEEVERLQDNKHIYFKGWYGFKSFWSTAANVNIFISIQQNFILAGLITFCI